MGTNLGSLSYIFLHGFLGRPGDWKPIVEYLENSKQAKCHSIDYFAIPSLAPKNKFPQWTLNFGQWVRANLGAGPHTLVGYSMGGRLALHALEAHPDLFNRGICISTNPGIFSGGPAERDKRLLNDEEWAQRFMHQPWSNVIDSWNNQPVFEGSKPELVRVDSDHRRDQLAQALMNWSLAKQKNFIDYLKSPRQPITWIVGEKDSKFVALSKELMATCPRVNFRIVQNAGHRVHIDAPGNLIREMSI